MHPVQAAEQARLAAVAAQNAGRQRPMQLPLPAPESVKDMSSSTRQVLEKLSSMLKDARPLKPSDARPDRAELRPAPDAAPKPSLASATNAEGGPHAAAILPAEPQTALSAGRDDAAATPH